jgi:hypothetical protein
MRPTAAGAPFPSRPRRNRFPSDASGVLTGSAGALPRSHVIESGTDVQVILDAAGMRAGELWLVALEHTGLVVAHRGAAATHSPAGSTSSMKELSIASVSTLWGR